MQRSALHLLTMADDISVGASSVGTFEASILCVHGSA